MQTNICLNIINFNGFALWLNMGTCLTRRTNQWHTLQVKEGEKRIRWYEWDHREWKATTNNKNTNMQTWRMEIVKIKLTVMWHGRDPMYTMMMMLMLMAKMSGNMELVNENETSSMMVHVQWGVLIQPSLSMSLFIRPELAIHKTETENVVYEWKIVCENNNK